MSAELYGAEISGAMARPAVDILPAAPVRKQKADDEVAPVAQAPEATTAPGDALTDWPTPVPSEQDGLTTWPQPESPVATAPAAPVLQPRPSWPPPWRTSRARCSGWPYAARRRTRPPAPAPVPVLDAFPAPLAPAPVPVPVPVLSPSWPWPPSRLSSPSPWPRSKRRARSRPRHPSVRPSSST